VLWDKQTKTIVNNESRDYRDAELGIQRVQKQSTLDLYPEQLREKIDRWNEKIYHSVNNGVYRCGFAQTQEAYDEACNQLFATLDEIDAALETSRYLCGDSVTLADVRLSRRYSALILRTTGYSSATAEFRIIRTWGPTCVTCISFLASLAPATWRVKQAYYGNLFPLNPGGIIPSGPDDEPS